MKTRTRRPWSTSHGDVCGAYQQQHTRNLFNLLVLNESAWSGHADGYSYGASARCQSISRLNLELKQLWYLRKSWQARQFVTLTCLFGFVVSCFSFRSFQGVRFVELHIVPSGQHAVWTLHSILAIFSRGTASTVHSRVTLPTANAFSAHRQHARFAKNFPSLRVKHLHQLRVRDMDCATLTRGDS